MPEEGRKQPDEAPRGGDASSVKEGPHHTRYGLGIFSLVASPHTFEEVHRVRETRGSDSDHVMRGFVWRFSGARLPLAGLFRAVVVAVLPSVTSEVGVFEASASSG